VPLDRPGETIGHAFAEGLGDTALQVEREPTSLAATKRASSRLIGAATGKSISATQAGRTPRG
jgi:hypothetical protein